MLDRMDAIQKQRLNIILLVDVSTSMKGKRIKEVNDAINDIITYLKDLGSKNSYISFYLTILAFGTTCRHALASPAVNVDSIDFKPIKAGGYSNLHLAYSELSVLLDKESKGGIMPDFGGIAPIIILLTDGHPTKYPIKEELISLKNKPWYKVSLRYGIAIELKDKRTISVLRDFVEKSGDVIECYDSDLLKRIVEIIVVESSMIKSKGNSVHRDKNNSIREEIELKLKEALDDSDDWEW